MTALAVRDVGHQAAAACFKAKGSCHDGGLTTPGKQLPTCVATDTWCQPANL